MECIFTIDYEIYGNGEGSLRELIYEPAEKLSALFRRRNVPLVVFVEAAELEIIQQHQADEAIPDVTRQIQELHGQGMEIGLHLHPQWYNARFDDGRWILDYREYNLCTLSRHRMEQILSRSLAYLRGVLRDPHFVPLSFRAGNWLLQPTKAAAAMLTDAGIRIDSSVFKGGLQRNHGLDYRRSLKNGFYWTFGDDVNLHTVDGPLLEIPTYSAMVPFWKMLTSKRVGLQRKSLSSGNRAGRMNRLLDYLRPWYPLKFDFCRMTSAELISMVERALKDDERDPAAYRPIVAIGHTKDLVDVDAVASLLSYLEKKQIKVTTFREAYGNC